MQEYPHIYVVSAAGAAEGHVTVASEGVSELPTMPPVEFGGPGGFWSPESLLVAAVANCLILSFRGTARAARLDWTSLSCDVHGELDRVDRVTRFVSFRISADLVVPAGTNVDKALRLLGKAEQTCLITNSLHADTHLEASVRVQQD
ncbi:MAG: OsmC family protein [Woeseiaceae bacterium]|jgi:organic hydroperoxide reductase OsmC/OhrA|nr:OsmC family protein [Woeseiaceae bacterium]